MLEFSEKTNLLEQKNYHYSLQDVKDPNLYRDIYNYEDVPKVAFNHRRVPMNMPKDIWITDTSFRDGQQSTLHRGTDCGPLPADEPPWRSVRHHPADRIFCLQQKRP